MKMILVTLVLLVLASLVAGCQGGKQAPIVDSSSPQQKAKEIQSIQNDPNMSPAQKAVYLQWQGRVGGGQGVPTGPPKAAPKTK